VTQKSSKHQTHAFKVAGVEFIDENGGGAGARLKKPGTKKPR
jgi:hypothetical protein